MYVCLCVILIVGESLLVLFSPKFLQDYQNNGNVVLSETHVDGLARQSLAHALGVAVPAQLSPDDLHDLRNRETKHQSV